MTLLYVFKVNVSFYDLYQEYIISILFPPNAHNKCELGGMSYVKNGEKKAG